MWEYQQRIPSHSPCLPSRVAEAAEKQDHQQDDDYPSPNWHVEPPSVRFLCRATTPPMDGPKGKDERNRPDPPFPSSVAEQSLHRLSDASPSRFVGCEGGYVSQRGRGRTARGYIGDPSGSGGSSSPATLPWQRAESDLCSDRGSGVFPPVLRPRGGYRRVHYPVSGPPPPFPLVPTYAGPSRAQRRLLRQR